MNIHAILKCLSFVLRQILDMTLVFSVEAFFMDLIHCAESVLTCLAVLFADRWLDTLFRAEPVCYALSILFIILGSQAIISLCSYSLVEKFVVG